MKTIGLLGGMSWLSTVSYYQALNRGVQKRLGELHSADICLLSVDFAPLEQLQRKNDWDEIARILIRASLSISAGGADFLLICSNTMHMVSDELEKAISIPILHIADATAQQLLSDGVHQVGLLGTRFTMSEGFYKDRLSKRYGIQVVIPGYEAQNLIDRIIFDELCQGVFHHNSRMLLVESIDQLVTEGAEAVILGCTEIGLLVRQSDTNVQLYDTTVIHTEQAINLALASD